MTPPVDCGKGGAVMPENSETSLDIFTRYAENGASSRLRHYRYAAALESAGFRPVFHPFFSAAALDRLYAGGGRNPVELIGSYSRRLLDAATAGRRWWIEYELLPKIPAAIETLCLAGRRYVLSFDDAVWAKVPGGGFAGGKFDRLVRGAAGVIAANAALAELLQNRHPEVVEIPTAVDLDLLPPPGTEAEKFERFTVVWTGTPITCRYLLSHAEHLRAMSAAADFDLLVLSAGEPPRLPGVKVRFEPWSEAAENRLLRRAHVGIMPLDDDEFSRGKSAYKLIRYLAAGLPAIASPVGENTRVIRPGVTAFPARTPAEWAEALLRLTDPAVRLAMGRAARELAPEYSMRKYSGVLTAFLHRVLD